MGLQLLPSQENNLIMGSQYRMPYPGLHPERQSSLQQAFHSALHTVPPPTVGSAAQQYSQFPGMQAPAVQHHLPHT